MIDTLSRELISSQTTLYTETSIWYKTPDGINLSGVLSKANDGTTIFVICHGLMGNKNTSDRIKLAYELAAHNVNSFRFDFRSFGESSGKDTDMTLSGESTDLDTTLNLLHYLGYEKVWLLGGSLGCAVVSMVDFQKHPEIEKLILWFGVFDYKKMTAPFFSDENRADAFTKGYATIHSLRNGTEYHFGPEIFHEIDGKQPYEYLMENNLPKLFVHGTGDTIVPWTLSEETSKKCPNSKLVLIKDGQHSFSGSQRELNEAIQATLDFIGA